MECPCGLKLGVCKLLTSIVRGIMDSMKEIANENLGASGQKLQPGHGFQIQINQVLQEKIWCHDIEVAQSTKCVCLKLFFFFFGINLLQLKITFLSYFF